MSIHRKEELHIQIDFTLSALDCDPCRNRVLYDNSLVFQTDLVPLEEVREDVDRDGEHHRAVVLC